MAGGKINAGVIEQGGARNAMWMNNLAIILATTTNTGDTVRIASADGSELSPSNYGWITLPGTTAGQLSTFSITANVSIILTGAHWGIGTQGDVTGGILRVLGINDNGTLRWGVAYQGGRTTLTTTDTNATATNINLPEEVLCTAAVASATNRCREIGYVRADFDDTGGASEDLWAIQSGIDDVVTGESADGVSQPWVTTFGGFTANIPTSITQRWCQIKDRIFLQLERNASGTSNATTFTLTAPVKAKQVETHIAGSAINNNTTLTTPLMVKTAASSTTLNLYTDPTGAAWTNVNSKAAFLTMDYEAYQ